MVEYDEDDRNGAQTLNVGAKPAVSGTVVRLRMHSALIFENIEHVVYPIRLGAVVWSIAIHRPVQENYKLRMSLR
ncbi:hypothetical protein GCM10007304_48630 [Rhodococcoides trifolii]|uniref:Uncharacterized protein n=1 Tax=Rhodococcoides trifolii TaxID=908250 RepID=A0A917G9B5_9NOCA|nr:hypothetical protein GCM10007304_48630 [Rhodococcus trifolii]